MRALGHHVMREDERFRAEFEHRAVVIQAARARVQRQLSRAGEKLKLVHVIPSSLHSSHECRTAGERNKL